VLRTHAPTDGRILYRTDDGSVIDLAGLDPAEMRAFRRDIQMIFQDPYSSLDPRMTVLNIIGEPLRHSEMARGSELEDRVRRLAEVVGLNIAHLKRYPHAFSGGQRQRIGIARALATNPRFVVCDEPVSALDVSIQAQILNLLQDLQQEFQLTYLFIAHDLSVVEHISDRVAVMYVGKVVELAETEELFNSPKHPYTEALMSAVPKPDPTATSEEIILKGEIANPANPPSGCYFHPRCPYAQEKCRREAPPLREISPGHSVACHFAEELELSGVAES
jgi:peptide/nickel transport system ATP-binding protein